jgi:hypothetical protein
MAATSVPLELVTLDVKAGAAMESQSGLAMLHPRIYGAFARASIAQAGAAHARIAAIVMHPTSNFMGHYLLQPLAARGISCLALNSRYPNNDTQLLMERVIQDLGAGVRWLRLQGVEKVVLLGNSGGAALMTFYQAQAERLTCESFADGSPTHFVPQDFPMADGIALMGAHEGRSRLFLRWIDPSVTDEHDPLSADPSLDMYNPANARPYTAQFLERFTKAQRARRDRIEAWVLDRLETLKKHPAQPQDQAFVIYRTHAEPRCLDLSIDVNDRAQGSIWGDARAVNYAGNAMGRYTSLRAFLSQWSSRSQADGPTNIARTTVPLLHFSYTADQSTFPSTRDAWMAAGGGRMRNIDIVGGNHYLAGQPHLVAQVADELVAWAKGV